jgi:hypothetical protein
MKNIFIVLSICITLLSCSSFQKTDVIDQAEHIIISNDRNSDTISIKSTAHTVKDVISILDTLQLGRYNPESIEDYFGKAKETKIDTSEYGEFIESGTFYMDTHDYTVFEYNENGMLKEFRYDAGVRSDLFHQTKYYYSNNRIDSITTINQTRYAIVSQEDKTEKWQQDKICKFIIRYTADGKTNTLEAHDLRNDTITNYNIAYRKPTFY